MERATQQKLFDEYVNRVFEVRSDVETLLSEIRFLNAEIAAFEAAGPELQKLEQDYSAALAAGRIDMLTYYAAWNDLTSNRMNLVTLKGQLAQAVTNLESATGLYNISPSGEEAASAPPVEKDSPR